MKNFFAFFVIIPSDWISDDPIVLTQEIGLSLAILFNHRGSSMNLGFQLINRVLTREIPINHKKKRVKVVLHYTQRKSKVKIGKEKIQEACSNNQHQEEWADLIFWHYHHKRRTFGFLFLCIFREDSLGVSAWAVGDEILIYSSSRGSFHGLPISIKYMIGLKNVSRFRRLQMI